MVGERLGELGEESVVAAGGVLSQRRAPGGIAGDPRELALVFRIVAGGERLQQVLRLDRAALESEDAGEVSARLGILRQARERSGVRSFRRRELAAPLREQPALKVDPGEWKRRAVPVRSLGGGEIARGRGGVSRGPFRRRQRSQRARAGIPRHGAAAKRDRALQVPARLQDRGAQRQRGFTVPHPIEVAQSSRESVQRRAAARARQKRFVGDADRHRLLAERRDPPEVRDAAGVLDARLQQLDQRRHRLDRSRRALQNLLLAGDLRRQVRDRERAVGGRGGMTRALCAPQDTQRDCRGAHA